MGIFLMKLRETSRDDHAAPEPFKVESISAITLPIENMSRAVQFYQSLGFILVYGGETSPFTSFAVGSNYVNLAKRSSQYSRWGRVIFYVSDVDRMYQHVIHLGLQTDTVPRDAEWNERYFHLTDPDGNELSFAHPLPYPEQSQAKKNMPNI